MNEHKFELGRTVVTRGVHEMMQTNQTFKHFVERSLGRHANADWGDLCEEDSALNDEALTSGEDRLFSSYTFDKKNDIRIWIITEWDRSVTTILFPHEY